MDRESFVQPPVETLIFQDPDLDQKSRSSTWEDLRSLFNTSTRPKSRRRILGLIAAAVIVLCINVAGEIRMNIWQGDFYRAIEKKQLEMIGMQAGVFILIMLFLLTLVVTQNWLLERLKIRVREFLTNNLLDEWLKSGRAYRLNMTSNERLNPDQRLQEDIRNFSESSGDLGIGSLRATMILLSFIGVLWNMSQGITLKLFGITMQIDGYMVWIAVIYAAIGSVLAAWIGGPLIHMNEERYSREAGFRYSLVRVSDNAESIAFYAGEADERRAVDSRFRTVLEMARRLSFAHARLTWIALGHGWLVVILPVLAALPGYLQGKLDFGGLMMVVGAFNQVQGSLRWFVDNFGRIAEWRSALRRVMTFRDDLASVDEAIQNTETIKLEINPENHLAFEQTGVNLIDGQVVIADATAKIFPGERVLLVGDSGSGKSTLLRALGGLWPWGTGKILIPPPDQMMFLPQKPYMPLGTLASSVSYPRSVSSFRRSEIENSLKRVNLAEFIPMLDETARWDNLMSLGQQQRLAFARILLQRPKWVFLDEATSALDEQNQELVMSIFSNELRESALLSIGHRPGLEKYHTRTLLLRQTDYGGILIKPKTRFFPLTN